jgi:hypothetical protein
MTYNIAVNPWLTLKIYDSVAKTTLLATKFNAWTTDEFWFHVNTTFILDAPLLVTNGTTYYIEMTTSDTNNVDNDYFRRALNWLPWQVTYKNGSTYPYILPVSITWYYSISAWNVYKTDASNSSKINFVWFAANTAITWNNILVDTSWISNTKSWLTTWSDYYLTATPWAIWTTPWTNLKYIWTAISPTWISIRPNWLKWIVWTTVWAAWWASALPATPLWYVTTNINWLTVKVPYYNI